VVVEANKALKPDKTSEAISPKLPPSRDAAPNPGPSNPGEGADLKKLLELVPRESHQTLQTVAIFAVASLVPAGLLMVTAFVRINIVLMLLRQALGSPQVPGNQVLTVLALMLTFLVMEPIGERIYREALVPLAAQKIGADEAMAIGIRPVKSFMAKQIVRTNHREYLLALHREYLLVHYDGSEPPRSGLVEPEFGEDFPLHVLAPAFLLSELTTALMMGFFLYLPFLVIDLVVSSVLASMGLFMLPPTTVAMPVKLILFVMADGWLLVSKSLLASFAVGGPPV
jgi:flagellar biosynthetic protein FliP